ncbi:MAG: S41 family peptidase, partial [Muribaculaceae bacterium]|nr:S41 family peptidase [Muribaculaceae bacterium]
MSKPNRLSAWTPLIAAAMFILGFLAGDLVNRENGPTAAQKKFQTILNLVRNEYVDEVDLDSLIEKTIPSLLTNLDPHSAYIPASDLQAVNEDLDGSFSGVGIQFMIDNDTIKVLEVIPGGPAEKVGVIPGDRIIKVDGEDVAGVGITQEKVLKTLRGEKNSKVQLQIKRSNSKKPLTYTVTRGDIPVNTVDATYIASPGIGYIKVNKFGRTTYDEFFQGLSKLRREGAEDFIIDLRGNTGGYMDPAIMMVNEFLPAQSTIVATHGRDERENTIVVSDGTGRFDDVPLVVLIDEFTASSSEIFSGAVQDNDRGLIVGRRSFGKGLVQRSFELPDSSELRLTVQRYYTPSGRCIQKGFARGENEAYEAEIFERYDHGENFSADSVAIDSADVYYTSAGRAVYGGGGIMPDVFVASDTTGINKFYIELANANLLARFAFEYVDLNRQDLNKAANVKELLEMLPSDSVLLSAFATYARQSGVRMRYYYLNNSRRLIVRQLKALIARDVLGSQAYFEIFNTEDPVVV